VQVVRALVQNAHLALGAHLHQLIPVTLTCLVAKNLGASAAEDHWSLRDSAAAVVGAIIGRFGQEYPDVQTRISRQLLKAFLDPSKPLATHYGARSCCPPVTGCNQTRSTLSLGHSQLCACRLAASLYSVDLD